MEVFTVSSESSFRLQHAVLLYGDSSHSSRGSISYASIHEANVLPDGRNEIHPGRPVTKEALINLMVSLVPQPGASTLFHPRLLGQGNGATIWYQPAGMRQVWFKCQELGGERSASVPMPGFVFITTQSEWFVLAYKGKQRPDSLTALFVSPLFNVWKPGKICVGNVTRPTGEMACNIEAWEDAFWRSWFTHSNVHRDKEITSYKDGFHALWRDLLDGKMQKFPEKTLVPHKRTLGEVWGEIIAAGA